MRCVDVCLGKVLLPHVDRQNPGSWISKRNRAEKGGHMVFFIYFYFTALGIFLIALFFISALDINYIYMINSIINIEQGQMLLPTHGLSSPYSYLLYLDSLSVPALL
jgi:hypothetical protein